MWWSIEVFLKNKWTNGWTHRYWNWKSNMNARYFILANASFSPFKSTFGRIMKVISLVVLKSWKINEVLIRYDLSFLTSMAKQGRWNRVCRDCSCTPTLWHLHLKKTKICPKKWDSNFELHTQISVVSVDPWKIYHRFLSWCERSILYNDKCYFN